MSFAFPALLVFLVVLPGIILRYAYARGTWGWASPTSMRRVLDELAYGVAFSIGLHWAWLKLAAAVGAHPDLRAVLALLIGNFGPNNSLLHYSLDAVADNPSGVAAYFLSLYLASAFAGNVSHRIVRATKLDHRTRLLRFNNYWYYMLTGEILRFREGAPPSPEPDGVYLSAVVNHGPANYLYRGIVADFTFDGDGRLDTIVLTDAHRRPLSSDRPRDGTGEPSEGAGASLSGGAPPGPDTRYYQIRGNFFILKYAEIRTLNLEYFWLEEETVDDQTAGTNPPVGRSTSSDQEDFGAPRGGEPID